MSCLKDTGVSAPKHSGLHASRQGAMCLSVCLIQLSEANGFLPGYDEGPHVDDGISKLCSPRSTQTPKVDFDLPTIERSREGIALCVDFALSVYQGTAMRGGE